ncbi:MAG: ATP-dependent DNA ligase [Verrucomicrobiales bacterium]
MSGPIHFDRGVYLEEAQLWLDPWDVQPAAFVSHAHSDHIARHAVAICSEATSRLMRARQGRCPVEHVLTWNQEFSWQGNVLKLLPAGHILGSSQLWIQTASGSTLYTGDFKLRPGLSAEATEWCQADTLIMETTYGLPRFVFPPTEKVLAQMIEFCRGTLADGDIPILLGYSLGKSQDILQALSSVGLRAALHPAVAKMTKVYQELGQSFPDYKTWQPEEEWESDVLICPPSAARGRAVRRLGKVRIAVLTGWAVDAGAIYRYQVDAAFPLSDHADYQDLLRYVELVQPKRVLTLHGYANQFAVDLRSRGIEAWSLLGSNQMELRLPVVSPSPRQAAEESPVAEWKGGPPQSWLAWVQTAEQIAATSSKLSKIQLLAVYLQRLAAEDLPRAVRWFEGKADRQALGAGWAMVKRALLQVVSLSEQEFRLISRRHQDIGRTVQDVLSLHKKPEASELSLAEIEEILHKIGAARGPGPKREALSEGLRMLSPVEAKYLVKLLGGDLRIGLKEGLLEDAIAQAFDHPSEAIREANMLEGSLSATATLALSNRLRDARPVPLRGIKVMLASPEPDAASAWQRLSPDPVVGIWAEDKFDGIRVQIHRHFDDVVLLSRDLRVVTEQFPELVKQARMVNAQSYIFDGEIIAFQEGQKLSFFDLQKRLGRQQGDLFVESDIPVICMIFDALLVENEVLLKRPLMERRKILEQLDFPLAMQRVAVVHPKTPDELEQEFFAAKKRGNEGLMLKRPESLYYPGRRGSHWVKLKMAQPTLDVVVVAAQQGHGRRSHVLSDYTFAVRESKSGELLEIGKAYSGLTDLEIEELTEHFLSTTIEIRGSVRRVKPQIVLEIAFDSIRSSNRHRSGLAMRFPRIKAIRRDKTLEEIDTLETASELVQT